MMASYYSVRRVAEPDLLLGQELGVDLIDGCPADSGRLIGLSSSGCGTTPDSGRRFR